MKISTLLLGLALAVAATAACSGGGTNGATPPAPSALCTGAAATGSYSLACASCERTACETAITAVDTDCSAVLSCWSQCACSDATCMRRCENPSDQCNREYLALTSCATTACSGACSNPVNSPGPGSYCSNTNSMAFGSCYFLYSSMGCTPALTEGACPSGPKLVGCCSAPVNGIVQGSCEYGDAGTSSEASCVQGGGTWTTTVPK